MAIAGGGVVAVRFGHQDPAAIEPKTNGDGDKRINQNFPRNGVYSDGGVGADINVESLDEMGF